MIVDEESGVGVDLVRIEDTGTFSVLTFGFMSLLVGTQEISLPVDDSVCQRLVVELTKILEKHENDKTAAA